MKNKNSEFRWSKIKVLRLIREYQSHRCLWDHEDPHYASTDDKNLAWQLIASVFNVEQMEVRKKMKSLLGGFRKEVWREKMRGGVYRSKWFAYNAVNCLLHSKSGDGKEEKSGDGKEDNNSEKDDKYSGLSDDDSDEETNQFETIKYECEDSKLLHINVDEINRDKFEISSTSIDNLTINNGMNNYQSPWKNIKSDVSDEPMNNTHNKRSVNDCFGEYIALKISTYDKTLQNIIQHKISQILFKADMGLFNSEVLLSKTQENLKDFPCYQRLDPLPPLCSLKEK